MSSSVPLVSAIMPTRGRRELAARALASFLAQTWLNKELVVLDDRDDPSFAADLPSGVRRIVSVQRLSVGAKRNVAVAQARGDIIVHFDSDDWSAPDRITEQAVRLLRSDYLITGYNSMLFTDGSDWWRYKGAEGYALGTSLMYRRRAWLDRAFPNEQISEDTAFISGRRVLTVDARDVMVAWVHAGNTSEKREAMTRAKKQYQHLGVA